MKWMAKGKPMILPPGAVDLIAARFRTLGEPIRIALLQALQEGEKNVTELVAIVGSTQPNVSKHLRILQDAGFIGRRQAGNNIYAFISDDCVFDLCDVVSSSIKDRLEQTTKLFVPRRR
jgi:DNA-binding transcriptional ArsR family regulator